MNTLNPRHGSPLRSRWWAALLVAALALVAVSGRARALAPEEFDLAGEGRYFTSCIHHNRALTNVILEDGNCGSRQAGVTYSATTGYVVMAATEPAMCPAILEARESEVAWIVSGGLNLWNPRFEGYLIDGEILGRTSFCHVFNDTSTGRNVITRRLVDTAIKLQAESLHPLRLTGAWYDSITQRDIPITINAATLPADVPVQSAPSEGVVLPAAYPDPALAAPPPDATAPGLELTADEARRLAEERLRNLYGPAWVREVATEEISAEERERLLTLAEQGDLEQICREWATTRTKINGMEQTKAFVVQGASLYGDAAGALIGNPLIKGTLTVVSLGLGAAGEAAAGEPGSALGESMVELDLLRWEGTARSSPFKTGVLGGMTAALKVDDVADVFKQQQHLEELIARFPEEVRVRQVNCLSSFTGTP